MMLLREETLPIASKRLRVRKNMSIARIKKGDTVYCTTGESAGSTGKVLKINTQDFLELASEVFVNWIPELSSVGFQAVWAGYYVEPKMVVDPDLGLFIGLRGQGFMLGQYLAKLYVDKLCGHEVPAYFNRLTLGGDGLLEKAFK